MLEELILKTRTYRRFSPEFKIDNDSIYELIDLARLSASPRNQQALKYIVINDKETNSKVFNTLSWAGALSDWNGPESNEQPSAYIIILGDNSIIEEGKKSYHEAAYGIAAQTIALGATEKGLGTCMIAAVKRKVLRDILEIHDHLEILLVMAIGQPAEIIAITEMEEDESYNYWRDEEGIHYVPKRKLEDIIINFKK